VYSVGNGKHGVMCVNEPLHLTKSHNVVKLALNPCLSHAQADTIQVDIPLLHNIRKGLLHPPEIESTTHKKRHGYKFTYEFLALQE